MTSLNNVYSLTIPNMKYDVFIDANVNNNADYSICSNLSIMSTRIKNKYLNKNTVFAINDYSGTIYNNNVLYTYMSKLKIVQVACGNDHSLLLENTGNVLAIGDNFRGQLGINSTDANSKSPTYVLNNTGTEKLQNIMKVACGNEFSLFLENSGNVLACGRNLDGQLGINTSIDTKINNYVLSSNNIKLQNIIDIGCGGRHSLFIENTKRVLACGYNTRGQLGYNYSLGSNLPIYIPQINNVIQVSGGNLFSLFLQDTGKVLACGANDYGQLGINDSSVIDIYTPAYVKNKAGTSDLTNIVQIATGSSHSVFLQDDGKVLSCGYNLSGQLGNTNNSGTSSGTYTPVDVLKNTSGSVLDNIIQVTSRASHTMFLENTGRVLACGNNSYNQLGDLTSISRQIPIYVLDTQSNLSLNNIVQISSALYYNAFLENTGKLLGCGNNASGSLGIGNIPNQYYYSVPVYGIINAHNIFQGQNYAYYYNNPFSNNNMVIESTPYNNTYIEYSSNIICNVYNYFDMYGNTKLLGGVLKIETGAMHSIFLRNDYKVYSCGNNFFGQLGTDNNMKYYQPQLMFGANNNIIIDISSGAYHNLLLTSNNSVFSCGRNNYGQLGLNDNTNRTSLTKISISDIMNIKCGENHSVFLNYSGNVYACGLNQYGQLSTNNTINYLIPAQVMSINGTEPIISNIVIRDIACGKNHTIMLGADKTVYTVGNNNNNQLGISYSDLPFSIYPRICFSYFMNYDLKIYSNAFIDKTYILLIV